MRLFWVFGIVALSLWLGGALWFSYLQSPLLFQQMREIFAPLQLLLLPLYWKATYYCLGAAAVFLAVQAIPKLDRRLFVCSASVLLALCATVLAQWLIHPKVALLMSQLAACASDPSTHALVKKEFGIWHGGAMILNLVTLSTVSIVLLAELFRPQSNNN